MEFTNLPQTEKAVLIGCSLVRHRDLGQLHLRNVLEFCCDHLMDLVKVNSANFFKKNILVGASEDPGSLSELESY